MAFEDPKWSPDVRAAAKYAADVFTGNPDSPFPEAEAEAGEWEERMKAFTTGAAWALGRLPQYGPTS